MKTNQYDPAEQKLQAIEAEMGSSGSSALSDEEIMPGVRPIWATDLNQMNFPEPSYLVDSLISKGGINAISSKPGNYKTMLAINIAKCVANGEPLFGVYETKQTKALIFDQESGHGRLKKRLAILGAANSEIAVMPFANIQISKDYAEKTIKYCQSNGIGLIIYDALTRFHSAKENVADEMSAVLANFQLLTQAGLTVIIIHHDPKSGYANPDSSNTLRGSSDILAVCDVHIVLQKGNTRGKITVKQLKNRDDEPFSDFELVVKNDENKTRLWFEHVGEAPRLISNDELIDEAILALLKERGRMFQGEIIEDLKEIGGEKKIPERLTELATNAGKLDLAKGVRGRKYFELRAEQSK